MEKPASPRRAFFFQMTMNVVPVVLRGTGAQNSAAALPILICFTSRRATTERDEEV